MIGWLNNSQYHVYPNGLSVKANIGQGHSARHAIAFQDILYEEQVGRENCKSKELLGTRPKRHTGM